MGNCVNKQADRTTIGFMGNDTSRQEALYCIIENCGNRLEFISTHTNSNTNNKYDYVRNVNQLTHIYK